MKAKFQDLGQRSVSATVLGLAVLFITWWHPYSFDALLLLGAWILWKEWRGLTKSRGALWALFGLIYIVAACGSLAAIRHHYGWEMVFVLFALVWMGDIAAYLIGSRYGQHKIAPEISPGKSWEGLAASILVTMAISVALLVQRYHYQPLIDGLAIGAAFAIVGLVGDLFESHLKRKAGVKDSGTLIPGHGGLFDRVDALMPCAILAAVILFS